MGLAQWVTLALVLLAVPLLAAFWRWFEETESNIKEAIEGHLRTLREFGDTVPAPTSLAREVEVSPAA